MIYLIGQLSIWLLLAAVSAGAAGWIYAADRATPEQMKRRAERDRLIQDLGKLAGGDALDTGADVSRVRAEADDSLARIRDSRIAELEQALEHARGRADDAAGEAAELRRQLERQDTDGEELTRLRALTAAHESERAREIEVAADPVAVAPPAVARPSEEEALQAWRLRYFEQRVQYLEGVARAAAASAPSPLPEWRVRDAQAQAEYLADEVRTLRASVVETPLEEASSEVAEVEPFAADADVDKLLRWRLLYLERRVAHLQAREAETPALAPVALAQVDAAPDPDRWKWRARYLEARVRHLEQAERVVPPQSTPVERAPAADIAPSEPAPKAAAPPAPSRRGAKPPVLASARNGAPDDLTLIEGISLLQQNTLYAIGIFHFDQIAAWTPDHVAWVDQYLRLRGRIDDEEWIDQADDLAREGPEARRVSENETA